MCTRPITMSARTVDGLGDGLGQDVIGRGEAHMHTHTHANTLPFKNLRIGSRYRAKERTVDRLDDGLRQHAVGGGEGEVADVIIPDLGDFYGLFLKIGE